MSPVSHLQVLAVEIFRRRAFSDSARESRHGSFGGPIDVQELAERYTTKTRREGKQKHGLLGSFTPRPQQTEGLWLADDSDTSTQEFSTLSPFRSEGWSTPQSPTTAATPCKRTNCTFTHQRPLFTSPPVSKYNHHGHDLHMNVSPLSFRNSQDYFLSIGNDTKPAKTLLLAPIELPGSLLMPSQGFRQSNPPRVPPRKPLPERTRSAPTFFPPYHNSSSTLLDQEVKMAKKPHQRAESQTGQERQTDFAPPPRLSSLPSDTPAPRQRPPPIPLSQMSLEELMHILPTLDAAIIAHDWIPRMQSRQEELKGWLKDSLRTKESCETVRALDQQLIQKLDSIQDAAKTYQKLFDVAQNLQEQDVQARATEIDEANKHRFEAVIALARHVAMHKEKCEQYEREIGQLKDKNKQGVDVLTRFIYSNLDEALAKAPSGQASEVFNVLVQVTSDTKDFSSQVVNAGLYENVQVALKHSNDERDGLRNICSEQIATIKEQSEDLDQYIAKMAKIVSVVQDKDKQIVRLKQELTHMREDHEARQAREAAFHAERQERMEDEKLEKAEMGITALDGVINDNVWARDAEITNLRRKLEKSHLQEQDLQSQIRQLLQHSHNQHYEGQPRGQSRIKRLLTGGSKGSPNLPTLNSMNNLSVSAFSTNDRVQPAREPASPGRTGRMSPAIASICEPQAPVMDHLELPAAYRTHSREGSSPNIPPRLRDARSHIQDYEIDSAVSNRFHQMPPNLRSTALGPRPWTPGTSSSSSYEEVTERTRPGCTPESGASALGTASLRKGRYEEERHRGASRVLSGITEVSEGGSVKRKSSSPDSVDKRMYLDSVHAAAALGQLQIG